MSGIRITTKDQIKQIKHVQNSFKKPKGIEGTHILYKKKKRKDKCIPNTADTNVDKKLTKHKN